MPDSTAAPVATPTSTAIPAESLLSTSDQPVVSENDSVLDTAGAEEKSQQEAADKALIESKPDDLSPDDQAKRAGLLKAKAEADTKVAEEARAKGVPEKYEIKAPEGMTLDEERLTRVTPIFKKLGITNAQAQGLSDYYAQMAKETTEQAAVVFKNWNEGNVKETMAALGANAKVELQYVSKVKTFFSPETIEALNASGIGNIKSFIFDMAKIGRLFSEEHLVNDKVTSKPHGAGMTSNDEMAQKLYPNMAQK